ERKEGNEEQYHLVERVYGAFSRSFQLPKNLDEGKIEASFEHGVLTVRIPKAALPQPKKIQVKAGASAGSEKVEAK
ncbi:MAG TPA: Hsp20/alpha crystallin family protein, partial [Gemmatimonadaceae bacterium]